jgi:hypothetical protein
VTTSAPTLGTELQLLDLETIVQTKTTDTSTTTATRQCPCILPQIARASAVGRLDNLQCFCNNGKNQKGPVIDVPGTSPPGGESTTAQARRKSPVMQTLRSFAGRNLLQDDASSALPECACDQGYTKAALSTSILLAKPGVVYIGSNASHETVTPCWPCDAVRVIKTECFDVVCAEDTRACGPVRREPSRTQQVTRNVLRVLLTLIWKMWLQHLRCSVCPAQHMLNLRLVANLGSTAYVTLVIRAPTAAPAPLAQKHSTRTPQAQLSALSVP